MIEDRHEKSQTIVSRRRTPNNNYMHCSNCYSWRSSSPQTGRNLPGTTHWRHQRRRWPRGWLKTEVQLKCGDSWDWYKYSPGGKKCCSMRENREILQGPFNKREWEGMKMRLARFLRANNSGMGFEASQSVIMFWILSECYIDYSKHWFE
jgi:hypothetical protein